MSDNDPEPPKFRTLGPNQPDEYNTLVDGVLDVGVYRFSHYDAEGRRVVFTPEWLAWKSRQQQCIDAIRERYARMAVFRRSVTAQDVDDRKTFLEHAAGDVAYLLSALDAANRQIESMLLRLRVELDNVKSASRRADEAAAKERERIVAWLRQESAAWSEDAFGKKSLNDYDNAVKSQHRASALEEAADALARSECKRADEADKPCALCGMKASQMLTDSTCMACERDEAAAKERERCVEFLRGWSTKFLTGETNDSLSEFSAGDMEQEFQLAADAIARGECDERGA